MNWKVRLFIVFLIAIILGVALGLLVRRLGV